MNGIGKWREIKSKTFKVLREDRKGNLQRMGGEIRKVRWEKRVNLRP